MDPDTDVSTKASTPGIHTFCIMKKWLLKLSRQIFNPSYSLPLFSDMQKLHHEENWLANICTYNIHTHSLSVAPNTKNGTVCM